MPRKTKLDAKFLQYRWVSVRPRLGLLEISDHKGTMLALPRAYNGRADRAAAIGASPYPNLPSASPCRNRGDLTLAWVILVDAVQGVTMGGG